MAHPRKVPLSPEMEKLYEALRRRHIKRSQKEGKQPWPPIKKYPNE